MCGKELSLDLDEYVKQVIFQEHTRNDGFLSKDDSKVLCDVNGKRIEPRETIFGYPSRPLYKEIANMLMIWMNTKSVTVSSLTPMLVGLKTLWTLWNEEEKLFRIREILMMLGRRGLLDLLGMRRTVGSAEMWPISRHTLTSVFKEKHSPSAELSVGARALAKHHHRDKSTSWWGTSAGTEPARNEHALKMMNRILDEASWINIHCLPHDVKILEIRQEEGYGVRWTADGSSFRGFVEPQMVDGHEMGWKH